MQDAIECIAWQWEQPLFYHLQRRTHEKADARDVFPNAMRPSFSESCTEKRRKSGAALSI